jgi:hypothetical protein
MRWAGHLTIKRAMRRAYRILAGKPEGERPRGSLGRKWEDNIEMDRREIDVEIMNWINLA